ncbi:MAG: patatin-like phospholipase family protein [Anaerolineae bacterium]|nr:patatin-like phospholipase family protein [Anaerolineae bacterium]
MTRTFKVLSIDGGGIRGIIAAKFLAEIEHCINQSISELFDFIAGTSTGGILALGLTLPDERGNPSYTAQEGVELYRSKVSIVFPIINSVLISKFNNLLLNEKYSSEGLFDDGGKMNACAVKQTPPTCAQHHHK